MRFSANNSASLSHSSNNFLSLSSSFRKVFSVIKSKLPQHYKISPEPACFIKNDSSTVIRRVPKKQTAVTKQEDINRNLRNYYANTNSRKRQLAEDDSSIQKSDEERQTRHKAVKQYQEQSSEQQKHWKEYSNLSFVDVNTYAPLKFKTHGYVRGIRSNSDCLRITALKNHAQIAIHTKRPYLKKRIDAFEWGKPSPLRNEI